MISQETVRVSYAGNNSTSTPYPITFSFRTKDDIRVVVRDSAGTETTLLVDVNFTVSGAELTTSVAVVPSSSVIIYRRTPATQSSDYVELSAFPAESHEEALDKLTLLAQEARDGLERCFRLKDSAAPIPAGGTTVVDSVMGLDPSGLPLFRTATEVMAWLSLASTVFNFPTKTWLNNAERALAVPDFIGQVGMQRDTRSTYMGSALSAGSWIATTSGGVADGAITTSKLADGTLSADSTGRAKMADLFITLAKLSTDIFTGATADTLFDPADQLFGFNGTEFRKYSYSSLFPPGSIVQTKFARNNTWTAVHAAMPIALAKPQITQGQEILSSTFQPIFATSKVRARMIGSFSIDTPKWVVFALFRNPVSDAIAAQGIYNATAGTILPGSFETEDAPATTSEITYSLRTGTDPIGGLYLNGTQTGDYLGSADQITLVLEEIKV